MRRLFPYPFAVLLVALLSEAAWAYVPPLGRILEAWYTTYDDAPPVSITGTWQQGPLEVAFKVTLDKNRVLKIEETAPGVTDSTTKLVWYMLLKPSRAMDYLIPRDFDLDKTGIARFDGKLAWTLGSLGEKQPGTQLWLNRENYTPLKVMLELDDDATGLVEFLGYDKSPSKLYPTEIRTSHGTRVRTYRIEKLEAIE